MHKRIKAALRASEAQFRNLAQAIPNHVWTAPPNGLLDWFNDRVYANSGLEAGVLGDLGWRAHCIPTTSRSRRRVGPPHSHPA